MGRYIVRHLYSVWCLAKICSRRPRRWRWWWWWWRRRRQRMKQMLGSEWAFDTRAHSKRNRQQVPNGKTGASQMRWWLCVSCEHRIQWKRTHCSCWRVCVCVCVLSVDWYSAASLPSHGTEKYKQNYFGCIVFFLDVWQGLFFIYFIVYHIVVDTFARLLRHFVASSPPCHTNTHTRTHFGRFIYFNIILSIFLF